MAEINPFEQISGQLVDQIFSGVIWFIIALVIAGSLLGFLLYIRYRKKFDIEVLILSKRATGKDSLIKDKGAILRDRKDGHRYLRLLGQRVELPETLYEAALQRTNKGDYIEFLKKSEREYVPIGGRSINKEYMLKYGGKIHKLVETDQKMVEGDVAYWNLKRKEANKDLFSKDSWLMKILPYLPQIIGGMITIFILYILMDFLPDVLSALSNLVQELRSLKGADIVTG